MQNMIKCIFLFSVITFGCEIPDEQNLALNEKAYLANTNLEFTNATNHGCDELKGLKENDLYYIDLRKIRHIKKICLWILTKPKQDFFLLVSDQNSDFNYWVSLGKHKATGPTPQFSLKINRQYLGLKMTGSLESVKICNVSITGAPEEFTNIESSWFEWTKNEDIFNLIKDRDSSTCVASHNAEAHHFHVYIPHGDSVKLTVINSKCITGKKDCKLEYTTSDDMNFPKEFCNIDTNSCASSYLRNLLFRSEQRNKHIIELCKLSFLNMKAAEYYNDFKWVQNHNTSLLSDGNTQSCLVTPWLFVNGALIVLPLFRRLNFIRIYATCKIDQKDCGYKVLIGDESFDCKRGWCEHIFTPGLVKLIQISFVEKAEFEVCEVSLRNIVTTEPTTTKQKGNRTLIPTLKKPTTTTMITGPKTSLDTNTTIGNVNTTMIPITEETKKVKKSYSAIKKKSKRVYQRDTNTFYQNIILILIGIVCLGTIVLTLFFTKEIKKYEESISVYRQNILVEASIQDSSQVDIQVGAPSNLKEGTNPPVENTSPELREETEVKKEKVHKDKNKIDSKNKRKKHLKSKSRKR